MGVKIATLDASLTPPPFPPQLDYLWSLYCQHTLGLASSGMAPAVVTWEGMTAWCRLMAIEIDPDEALVLVRLGREAVNAASERIAKPAKTT